MESGICFCKGNFRYEFGYLDLGPYSVSYVVGTESEWNGFPSTVCTYMDGMI